MAEHVEMNCLEQNESSRPLLEPPRVVVFQPADEKRQPGSDGSRKEEETENGLAKDPKAIEKRKNKKMDQNLEDEIDAKLKNGDLEEIKKWITPKKLTNCTTNCLEKSLEVSHKLKSQTDATGPDADDLNELASSVEGFAFQLLEPLKSDDWKRTIFEGKDFDRILDKALKYRQKKFISHPVIHDVLMTKRWTGYFGQNWFKWFLLHIWTFFDVFLFPLVHFFLWMIHLIIKFAKKKQELCIVFLFYLPWADEFQLTKIAATHEREIKYDSIDTIAGVKGKTFSDWLKRAESLFHSNETQKEAKNVLVVITDNRLEDPPSELQKAAESLKQQNVKVIYVGIYHFDDDGFVEYPDFKKLETLASSEENVVLIYNADSKTDRKKNKVILECIKGNDIYERYIQYFKTPYFIFVRDTISYLVLLGLHFVMCLQPSTIHFTPVEWIISVFFLGRFMIEIYQLIMENNSCWRENNKGVEGECTSAKDEVDGKQDNQDKNSKEKAKPNELKLRGIISGYLDDWWNKLDVVILIVYLILVGLRVFILSQHFSVSKNRLLAVAGYLYGLNAMFLTLRVFGNILEYRKSTGSIQIALFHVIGAVFTIFGQFFAATVAFSLAITKIHVAEISYNAGRNSTSLGLCGSQNALDCWWSFTRHLVWSLFGITELAPLESSNELPDTLARILYGLFLIMGVVMLMNMMIALLSNIYQQVEDNAFHEWSYKKASTIRTYNKYHPVPVPFNIISLSYIVLRNIYRTINGGTEGHKPLKNDKQHEESRKKKNTVFEKLVEDLKDEYFAKNGNVFPISDKKRTELVFKETKGNRNMNEWITHRIFLYNQQEMQRLKSHGDPEWKTVKHMATSGQRLELSFCDCEDEFCLHGARYCVPLSEEFPKFEVLIRETGEKRVVAIGVVTKYHKLKHVPGWFGNSAGYHIDEGRIFDSKTDPDCGRDGDDAMAFKGDIIGCEILYDKKEANDLPVSFTLNGRVIGEAEVDSSTGDEFYPFVGIGCKEISLVFKICPKDTLPQEDTVLQMLKTISEQQTKFLSSKPNVETDSVLHILDTISKQQQMTSDRLIELERKVDHLSRSRLQRRI